MATKKTPPPVETKYPKSLGACIDMLYTNRQERLAKQHEADELKEKEQALETHILNTFGKQELEGSKGKIATAAIKRLDVVSVEDYDQAFEWIKKHKAWDLLNRSLSSTGIKDVWKAGKAIPGVSKFTKISLSLNKIPTKPE